MLDGSLSADGTSRNFAAMQDSIVIEGQRTLIKPCLADLNLCAHDETHSNRLPIFSTPVEKYFDPGLTGPVRWCVLIKVNCSAQNPSAEMRGGFLRWGFAIKHDRCHSLMRNGASGNDQP
jgi:hypothetical protein